MPTESPLKVTKNVFYFTLKALFVLNILSFCLDFLVAYRNGLIKKIRLISNFKTSQTGQQTIVTHILSNISRSQDNRTMNLGQLIECNMRYIFLEKSYTNCDGETSPRPFSEKLKLNISLGQ